MITALNDFYGLGERITELFKRSGGAPPAGGGKGTSSTPYGGGAFCKVLRKVPRWTFATDFSNGADFGGISQVCLMNVFSKHIALRFLADFMQYLYPPTMKSSKDMIAATTIRQPHAVVKMKRAPLLIFPTVEIEFRDGISTHPRFKTVNNVRRPLRKRSKTVHGGTW